MSSASASLVTQVHCYFFSRLFFIPLTPSSGVGKSRLIDLLCEQKPLNVRTARTTGFYSGVLVAFLSFHEERFAFLTSSTWKIYSHAATGKDFVIELLEVPSHCKNANSRSFAYHALDGIRHCLILNRRVDAMRYSRLFGA